MSLVLNGFYCTCNEHAYIMYVIKVTQTQMSVLNKVYVHIYYQNRPLIDPGIFPGCRSSFSITQTLMVALTNAAQMNEVHPQ